MNKEFWTEGFGITLLVVGVLFIALLLATGCEMPVKFTSPEIQQMTDICTGTGGHASTEVSDSVTFTCSWTK